MQTLLFRQALINHKDKKFEGWKPWGIYDGWWHPPAIADAKENKKETKNGWFICRALSAEQLAALTFMWTGKTTLKDNEKIFSGDIVTAIIPQQGGRITDLVVMYDYGECGFIYRDKNGNKVVISSTDDNDNYNIGSTDIEEITGNIITDGHILEKLIEKESSV